MVEGLTSNNNTVVTCGYLGVLGIIFQDGISFTFRVFGKEYNLTNSTLAEVSLLIERETWRSFSIMQVHRLP